MELGIRCFFRLGVCLLIVFVVFRNFRGFPQETEAIAIRFGYRNRAGGYNSNYGGRMIYTNFGRSRSNFGNRDPVDKDRLYYETKMAQWREQNKHLFTKNETSEDGQGQGVDNDLQDFDQEDEDNNSDSQEYDYDYQETESTTTTTTVPQQPTEEGGEETVTTIENVDSTSETPTTTTTTSEVKLNRGSRKSFGLRYGRVKVETLRH